MQVHRSVAEQYNLVGRSRIFGHRLHTDESVALVTGSTVEGLPYRGGNGSARGLNPEAHRNDDGLTLRLKNDRGHIGCGHPGMIKISC